MLALADELPFLVPFPSYPEPGNVEFKGAVWQCNMRNLAALETLKFEFIVTGRSVLSPSHGSHDVSVSTVSCPPALVEAKSAFWKARHTVKARRNWQIQQLKGTWKWVIWAETVKRL